MLIGYVSDERYVAIADVALEFEQIDSSGNDRFVTRSTASGAVLLDLSAGNYRVTLAREGYGSKRVDLNVDANSGASPFQFRLLKNKLLQI